MPIVTAESQSRSTGRFRNAIREALATGEFLVTLEYTPETAAGSLDEAIRRVEADARRVGSDPRVRGFNVCDRVRSTHTHDTVEVGYRLANVSGKAPLLHLAGKDRTEAETEATVRRALGHGLENFLFVSGDKLAPETPRPVPYHDSVNAIHLARVIAPTALIAAVVSPFKYGEEELLSQYLKLVKKVGAGADYVVSNAGWDMAKHRELIWYRDARDLGVPLVANLFLLTRGLARKLNKRVLPGIRVTDDLLAKVEEEYADPDDGRKLARYRLALQMVGVKRLGYAGVHLSGVSAYEEHAAVLDMAVALDHELSGSDAWGLAWGSAHTFRDGRVANLAPPGGLYLFPDIAPQARSLAAPPDPGRARATAAELATFRRLAALDRAFFRSGSAGAALLGPLMRAMDRVSSGRSALVALERLVKAPIVGCRMCGSCRLPHTFFVCPETCPKGLANGACAGSDDGRCEFADRECIYNRVYRVAKAAGRLSDLETLLVPAVTGTRGTCSWVNHYRGVVPLPVRLGAPGRR